MIDLPGGEVQSKEINVDVNCHFPCENPQPRMTPKECVAPELSDFIDDSAYTVNDEIYYTDKGTKTLSIPYLEQLS